MALNFGPEYTAYALVANADISLTGDHNSAGARWLLNVQTDARESFKWAVESDGREPAEVAEDQDMLHEIADAAAPVYTAEIFAVYVDIQGWQADISELLDPTFGDVSSLPERIAQITLYQVARDIMSALFSEWAELQPAEATCTLCGSEWDAHPVHYADDPAGRA
jgi:hypothetical protein